jgi:hypothetical protein
MFKRLIFCLSLLLIAGKAQASEHLLYFEGQEIFGYSSALGETIAYSAAPDAAMQKPSVGIDYLGRFSGDAGDLATLALQLRLAATPLEQGQGYKYETTALTFESNGYKAQPQVYNAYLKVKTPWNYVWLGHNRPAFGLASILDSHGLLLSTLGMRFGYDRDWGVGAYKDLSWGDVSASVTSGSGMALDTGQSGVPFSSHHLAAARVSYGVLSRDNFTAGFSVADGKTLNTIGYTLLDLEPRPVHLAGMDLTILRDNFEHRFDFYHGVWLGNDLDAFFYRFSLNLDEEGRYKLEAQPVYWKLREDRNYQDALCFSVRATSDLTVRTEYIYDHQLNDNRFLLQLYFYGLI